MIHFNIFPAKQYPFHHGVTIYLADCQEEKLIEICKYIKNNLDTSIAELAYCDWDWLSSQGVIRLVGARGCEEDTLKDAISRTIWQIKNEIL